MARGSLAKLAGTGYQAAPVSLAGRGSVGCRAANAGMSDGVSIEDAVVGGIAARVR